MELLVRENVRMVKAAVSSLQEGGTAWASWCIGMPTPTVPYRDLLPSYFLAGPGGIVGSLPRSKAVSVMRLTDMFGLVPSVMARSMQGRCTPAGSV